MKKNRMIFSIMNGIKKSVKSPVMNISIVLSMIVGLFFPLILVSYGVNEYSGVRSSTAKYLSRSYVADSGYTELTDDKIKGEYSDVEIVSRTITWKSTIKQKNRVKNIRLIGVTKSFKEFYHKFLEKGRYFTDDEFEQREKVCILGKSYIQDFEIGDSVKLKDDEYKVIGFAHANAYKKEAIIPFEGVHDTDTSVIFLQFKKGVSEDRMYQITEAVSDPKRSKPTPMTKFNMGYLDMAKRVLIIFSAIGVGVFLYSAINIVSVLINKVKMEQRSNAIKMAHGAKKTDILLDNFMEMNLLTTIAVVVDSILILVLSKFISLISINITVVLGVTFLNLLWNLIVVFVLINKNFKSTISENILVR